MFLQLKKMRPADQGGYIKYWADNTLTILCKMILKEQDNDRNYRKSDSIPEVQVQAEYNTEKKNGQMYE